MLMSLITAPTYEFDYDEGERLLQLVLKGAWDAPTLARFTAEMANLAANVRMATSVNRRGRILIDLSNFPVQRAEIIEALAQLLPALGQRAGKVAVVKSTSALQNRQNHRLLRGDGVQIVEDRGAGLAWLARPTDT